MIGFTKTRYKRIMDKLYFNRPMHRVDILVRTTTQAPHNQVQITNVPCMVNIISSDTQYDPTNLAIQYITKKVEIVIESKYLKDKKFNNGTDLIIPLTLANSQNGGYTLTNLDIKVDNTDSSKLGYPYGALQINYGEYIDGGYGEYIKYVIFQTETIV